jgi:hypothetical protein
MGVVGPTEEHAMATGPDGYQELSDRINAAAADAGGAADEARFIVPWRTDFPFEPTKEHDSCGSGQCGCGISPDDK